MTTTDPDTAETTAPPSDAPSDANRGGTPERPELNRLARRVDLLDDDRPQHTVLSPIDGTALGTMPIGTADDVTAALAGARRAQRLWAETSPKARASILADYADLVLEHREELCDLIQLENGKSRAWAFEEVADTTITARYYAKKGPKALSETKRASAFPGLISTIERRVPKGVVGIISPWNYPLSLAIGDAIAALMAGNGVVLKPDSQTPYTALRAVELLEESGLPKGLMRVVTGQGRVVGTAIIEGADYVMFTGSSETGAKIAEQSAARLVDFSAELGGKNAMVVTDDIDVERAAKLATIACFANSGQLCISIERIYVLESVAEAFTAAFAEATSALRLGSEVGYGPEMGPLASEDQLDKMRAHVTDAVAKGARVLSGGNARPDLAPWFHEPTILTDVPENADVFRGETFGPLVSIYPVGTIDEAVAAANDTDYGLNASVLCDNASRGRAIARRLQAGTVNVNDGYAAAWSSLDAPMGGVGISGVGRRHGEVGLLKYTEAQNISTRSHLLDLVQRPSRPKEYAERLSAALRLQKYLPF
ncbi:MAG: succinic semialdehyde dehydrogenase [Microthrixaceae bacterium]